MKTFIIHNYSLDKSKNIYYNNNYNKHYEL